MNEKEPTIQFSKRALSQIKDLITWLGEAHATSVVEAALASAWHIENERRQGRIGVPWIVRPGPHYFRHEDAAVRWLEERGAQPVSPGTWAAYDENGLHKVWGIEPLWPEGEPV
jgi:hypothetical protein